MKSIVTFLAVLSSVIVIQAAVSQELTTGTIEGVVTDSERIPIAGATVTITSEQGDKSTTSDAHGRFRFPYLTAGEYRLDATSQGFMTYRSEKVDVRLGHRVHIDVVIRPGDMETVEVVARAPVLDLTSTTTGTTISSEIMSMVPIGRNFSSTLALAPGVVESGLPGAVNSNPSINGASGLENVYMVDGVNIGNTGFGSAGAFAVMFGTLGTGVNFDYIKEVQVKTGGYEPEYGEALGGYINLVTKTGTNEIKGSQFAYLQAADLEANHTRTDRANAPLFDLVGFESRDFGFEIGGPFVKDKAFWYVTVNPTFTSLTRRTSAFVRDTQGFDHELEANRRIYNYAANVNWSVNPQHTVSVSAFGDPSTGEMGPQRPGLFADDALSVPNPVSRFSEITFGGHNVIGRWNGQLLPNWLGEVSIAYHTDDFEEKFAANEPQGFDFSSGSLRASGGVGFFTNSESRNIQYRLKLSNFVQAAGEHNFRYGVEFQDIGFDNLASYTGDPLQFITSDDTLMSTSGFIWEIPPDGQTFQINRIRVGELSAETDARYLALFLSDTWSITNSLSIMAGVRYEQEKLIGNVSEFTWDGNWAPRTHVTWDPTNDGRSKVSFSYGRFFGKIPNDLAVRALSSEENYFLIYPIENVDLTGAVPRIIGPPSFDVLFGDVPTRVDENSKLAYQDEYVVGLEREVIPLLNLGVSYMHRRLGRALEDISLSSYRDLLNGDADFGEYFVTNPGPELGFPEPTRKYNAVTVKAEKRWRNDWQLLSSYRWSRLKGNYEGYFRRDNGQSDPAYTSLFDFPYLEDQDIFQHLIDEDGILPNDRTHVLNLNGTYGFDFGLNAGLGLRVQSGVPITRLGYNAIYASTSEIPLEERGASGRTPTTTEVGLHLDYSFALGSMAKRVDVIFDVFNLFNQREGVDAVSAYELGGNVEPPDDTPLDPCPECLNPDFGKPLNFQRPRQFRFALRTSF